jgi:hypothetical protein
MDYQCSPRSLSIKQAVELAGHSREERAVVEGRQYIVQVGY